MEKVEGFNFLRMFKDTAGQWWDGETNYCWTSPKGPMPDRIIPPIGIKVGLMCDFGNGIVETTGRMYHVKYNEPGFEDVLVFSDGGGWCTDYVLLWRYLNDRRLDTDCFTCSVY